MNKNTLSYIQSFATIIVSVVFLLLPVFFLTITTDYFTFPKQILVITASLLLFILWGIKVVLDKKITFLSNPLNIPVLLFMVVVLFSTLFSASRQDSLLQSVPVLLVGLFFFTVVNFIQDKASFTVALTCLILGSISSALLSVFAQLNIYVLPYAEVRNQFFNTFGSPVQYVAFILPVLILCAASVIGTVKKGKFITVTRQYAHILQLAASIALTGALAVVIYQIIIAPQKPILLQFNHGFQIAFSSISQDTARLAQSLLVGSGYGTFITDFTRFVTPTFNSLTYWNLPFSFSSSYVLELLATTGIMGLFSFSFIFVSFIKSRGKDFLEPLFLSVLSIFILSLIIPFSFAMVFLLFGLLALFVSYRAIEGDKNFDTVSIKIKALRQGLISVTEDTGSRKENVVISWIILVVSIVLALFIGLYLTSSGGTPRKGFVHLFLSDIKFAKSFAPDALKSGVRTYNLQTQAIAQYPYRSDYYRIFSQINLALAANLVTAQQGKTPNEQVQQNIISLLQQSINSARQAVTLSPLTSVNWQNLGQIYRNLIGVGQNAEQFAIASYNQAIALNPSNPALRIELGGIYLQLQQWDLALNQFLVATQLKSDYANAYYNLGKAYELKGDLQNALSQYKIVKQLVSNNKSNLEKIDDEIKSVEGRIGAKAATAKEALQPTEDTTPLGVNKPQAEFPPKDPKVKIPEPPVTPAASESAK